MDLQLSSESNFQIVAVLNAKSKSAKVKSLVSQGTVLAFILFFLINNINVYRIKGDVSQITYNTKFQRV